METNKLVDLVLEWWKEHEYDTTMNGEEEYNIYDEEPNFVTFAKEIRENHDDIYARINSSELKYNSKYDDVMCECGHTYYRHFDPYENMEFVGCKYCGCHDFTRKEKI